MTTEQFAYWIQGFSEIVGTTPTAEQWIIIQDHLKKVFTKVTPIRDSTDTGGLVWPIQQPYEYPIWQQPTNICSSGSTTGTTTGYPEGTTVNNTDNLVTYC